MGFVKLGEIEMIKLEIQGYDKPLEIENIVFDYNGTIALDGKLSEETKNGIIALSDAGFGIAVLTADTFGTVIKECETLPVSVHVFDKGNAEMSKMEIVDRLGAEKTAAVGNGRNDMAMMEKAVLGVGIIGMEGAYGGICSVADIVVTSVQSAVELFLNPGRIQATLRR